MPILLSFTLAFIYPWLYKALHNPHLSGWVGGFETESGHVWADEVCGGTGIVTEAQENEARTFSAGDGSGGSLEASGGYDRTLLPIPATMLCLFHSDMEETRYKIPILHQFVGIDIGRGPDSGQKARFYRFRRLPEQNGLVERGI